MTILPSNIGSNKRPTAKLLTMRNVSHPHQFQHCLTFILSLPLLQSKWLRFLQNVWHDILFHNYASLQISQINRRNYFSWLKAHISLGMKQNEQLIFPYLFSEGPEFFTCTRPGTCGSQSAAIRLELKMNGLQSESLICWEFLLEGKVTLRKFPCCGNTVKNYLLTSA